MGCLVAQVPTIRSYIQEKRKRREKHKNNKNSQKIKKGKTEGLGGHI